jgi:hypothetical protein
MSYAGGVESHYRRAAVNQIQLEPIAADQPTSYIGGGRTRNVDGSIPHISQVLSVGRVGGTRWVLAPTALADWEAVQRDVEAAGGEPVRLTEALRDQATTQAMLRSKYEAWVAAGRPHPGGAQWNASTMSTAFACRPGESFHGCGMSVDIDVGALYFPGCARGSDQALGKFWEIAGAHGWRPIIPEHEAARSEAWHFDHIDELSPLRDMFELNGIRPTYGQAARAANALAGKLPVPLAKDVTVAYLQARLLLAGFWAGPVDGVLGAVTKAAFKAACPDAGTRLSPNDMVSALNAVALGEAQIESL